MNPSLSRSLWCLNVTALAAVGCSNGGVEPTAHERIGASEEPIIGGAPGGPPQVGHMFPMNQPINFCTATLVAPTMVLLAKHCIYVNEDPTQQHLIDTTTIRFSLANTNDSSQWTDGVDAVRVFEAPRVAPPTNGDRYFEGALASDVAVYQLSRPITSVPPIAISPDPLGSANPRFTAVGFGRVAHTGTAATSKNMGMLTYGQTGGSYLQRLFPTVDAYIAAVEAFSPLVTQPADAGPSHQTVAGLRDEYQHEKLAQDYETWFQAGPGDAQVCFGDSGGPLLQADASGAYRIFGVVSGSKSYSLGPDADKCQFGSVYATFGPDTLAFLQSLGLATPSIDGGPPGPDSGLVTGVGGAGGMSTGGAGGTTSGAGGTSITTSGSGGTATTGPATTSGTTGTTTGPATTTGAATTGTATTGGTATGSATTGGAGGASSTGPQGSSSDGCSCSTAHRDASRPFTALLLAASLAARRRRRVTKPRAG